MGDMAPLIALLQDMSSRLARVEAAVGSGGGGGGGGGDAGAMAAMGGGGGGGDSKLLGDFDAKAAKINKALADAMAAMDEKHQKDATKLNKFVSRALDCMRKMLSMTITCKRPDGGDHAAILKQVGYNKLKQQSGRFINGSKPLVNHMKAVDECMSCVPWVLMSQDVSETLTSYIGGSEYYANKARMAFKKGPDGKAHMDWCAALKNFVVEVKDYCVKNGWAKTGPQWQGSGDWGSAAPPPAAAQFHCDAERASAAAAAPAPAKAAPAPAPAGGGMSAMFAELNTLKTAKARSKIAKNKVSDDMKVYKNASLRGNKQQKKKKIAPKKKAGAKPLGPPKCMFDKRQKIWYVENQPDGVTVEVQIADSTQSVTIYKCMECNIIIHGKAKMISVAMCKKTYVCFDDLLSNCELANSKSLKVQVMGICNSFQLDKVDGCKMTVSKGSMGAQFTTAQCSEMNIEFPDPDDPEGLNTFMLPIPEQFVATLYQAEAKDSGNYKVKTVVSDLYGH